MCNQILSKDHFSKKQYKLKDLNRKCLNCSNLELEFPNTEINKLFIEINSSNKCIGIIQIKILSGIKFTIEIEYATKIGEIKEKI